MTDIELKATTATTATTATIADLFRDIRTTEAAVGRAAIALDRSCGDLADVLFAAYERRADIREAGIVRVKINKATVSVDPAKHKLDAAGGFIDYVIARCGLKMQKRQLRRGLTAGAVRAHALARKPELNSESRQIPTNWDACEALVGEIESDRTWDPKNQKWIQGPVKSAQAFRGLTLGAGDPNVVEALNDRLDETAEKFAKDGADQLAIARDANGGAQRRDEERKRSLMNYGKNGAPAEIRKMIAKLAHLALGAEDPDATLCGWAQQLRNELDAAKIEKAIDKAREDLA